MKPLVVESIAFCECGRPMLKADKECRECRENGLRRIWREDAIRIDELTNGVFENAVPYHEYRRSDSDATRAAYKRACHKKTRLREERTSGDAVRDVPGGDDPLGRTCQSQG